MTAEQLKHRRRSGSRGRSAGSILVIVVALLTLVALIGTALIATARVDRYTTSAYVQATRVTATRSQFEVQFNYDLSEGGLNGQPHERYRVEAYYFFPSSMGISSLSFPRDAFYRSLNAYIRFRSPEISELQLLDPLNRQSPLNTLSFQVKQIGDGQPVDQQTITNEARLFGAILSGLIRRRLGELDQKMAAAVLRRMGTLDAVLEPFLRKEPPEPVRNILRIGAAGLLLLDTPGHAAVATAVGLAKRRGLTPFSGLINAVLRKVAVAGPGALEDLDSPRLDTPAWLWTAWGQSARAIATAHQSEAPLDVMRDVVRRKLGPTRG